MSDERKIRKQFEREKNIDPLKMPAVRYNMELIKWLIPKYIEALKEAHRE